MRPIHIIHPTRGRPKKSFDAIYKFIQLSNNPGEVFVSVSIDDSDPFKDEYLRQYQTNRGFHWSMVRGENESAVAAINNAANKNEFPQAIIMVVSDDTDCEQDWDRKIKETVADKTDFIIKTQDGIQPWIITNPILDFAYYMRERRIYDPDFKHMFCDTWLTVQADISGRKLTSNLMFRHLNDTIKDDVRKRSDATWDEGQRTFIQKLKQTPVENLRKITDQSMKNWIRTHAGIRL